MQVSIQTDKKSPKSPIKSKPSFEAQEKPSDVDLEAQKLKERKFKKLTKINRELIGKLKHQNDELTAKLLKKQSKPNRSNSMDFPSGQKMKENESVKRELSNAYKQIDMYKSVIINLKTKQLSISSYKKIAELQGQVKSEDVVIERLQTEIKHLNRRQSQQMKELNVFDNDDVKNTVAELQKQVNILKQKLKNLKKHAQKAEQIDYRQQSYQIQLEKECRRINNEYYPGNKQQEEQEKDVYQHNEISERQWQVARAQLSELKKSHAENNNKIQIAIRRKNRQKKSIQENQLKLKEKSKKLHALKMKMDQLVKLVKVRKSIQKKEEIKKRQNIFQVEKEEKKEEVVEKKIQKKNENERQVKKWKIPKGYCLEKGKVQPDCIFFSDKSTLEEAIKVKIVQVIVWANSDQIPNLIQFNYEDQTNHLIEGIQIVQNISPSLQMSVFKMRQGDYLHKIEGKFFEEEIISLTLISKLGKKMEFMGELAENEGTVFAFDPKSNETPSTVFGAYVRKPNNEYRICHIGIQFTSDW